MGMPLPTDRWTPEQVRALPDDGNRYELIGGTLLVTPAPRGVHQVAAFELAKLLDQSLASSGLGHVLLSPADISLGEEEILQPDVFVYQTTTGARLADWGDITQLLLVVEVLSPSSAQYDRVLKRRRYQRAGVPEYWIVDCDARLIERWRPGDDRPEITESTISWTLPGSDSQFELDVAAFFASLSAP